MTSVRDSHGQAAILSVVFLTALLGMAALVVDVGSWFHTHRKLQAAADAAALAGAQALPEDPGQAASLALTYADKNGGGLAREDVAISTYRVTNDMIGVRAKGTSPGVFSRLFGVVGVDLGAKAKARAGIPSAARWVAPIAVDEKHPKLRCRCYGDATELELVDLHKPGSSNAAGAFGLVNLDSRNRDGDVGAEVLGGWILRGYGKYMPLGKYRSSPSTEFNSSHIRNALEIRVGDELLFPVYRTIEGEGSRAQYHVVGWVGFHVTGFRTTGSKGKVYGWFTRYIAEGIQSEDPSQSDFGVRTISLVE